MIRIKAPRVWFNGEMVGWGKSTDPDDRPRRLYTESMHRRVLALVRAIEVHNGHFVPQNVAISLKALRAQANAEARAVLDALGKKSTR